MAVRPSPAPLAAAYDAFLRDAGTPFTVPGHKRAEPFADPFLQLDLPLAGGIDDLRLSGGYLADAERLAAALWGVERCRFSVGGSSHGNLTAAIALAEPGAAVIVPRTLHKSLFAGLVLAGLDPVWVRPDVDAETGLSLSIPPGRVAAAIAEHPQARAAFLVEPSFVGAMSDIAGVASVCHEAGLPLAVDQAWAGYLGFHPDLPAHAPALGADVMVTSAHKGLTSFTQGAMLFARAGRVDLGRLDEAFELANTTSPSGSILASIDRARALLADSGEELLGGTIELVAGARSALAAVADLRLLDPGLPARAPSVAAYDPTKLVIALQATGANGFAVERDLLADGIRLELTDRDTLIPIVTMADTEGSVGRLVDALRRSIERHRGPARPATASTAWSVEPIVAMRPRDAFFAGRERVTAARAIGRIAAELACPYPPGIPVIAPGEVVTAAIVAALHAEAAAGSRIAYCSDPSLETLLVVAR